MKAKNSKFGVIFTIISNLCVLTCLIIGLVILFQSETPELINEEQFIKQLEKKGCSVIDFQNEAKYTGVSTYLITDNACPYLISYTIFTDDEKLEPFFTKILEDIFYNNTDVIGNSKINVFSYQEYSTNGKYYKAAIRNKNSILYASVDKEYRKDIIEIFSDFNYHYEPNWNGYKIICCTFIFLLIIDLVSLWGIEKKTRNKGWISLIPFYNVGCLCKDVFGSAWYAILLFIPIGNVAFEFVLYYSLGRVFKKKESFCALLIFFPTIFLPLLAFDDSVYNK